MPFSCAIAGTPTLTRERCAALTTRRAADRPAGAGSARPAVPMGRHAGGFVTTLPLSAAGWPSAGRPVPAIGGLVAVAAR